MPPITPQALRIFARTARKRMRIDGSRRDHLRARESFERLEPRTAKRVLAFYGTRRSMLAGASLPVGPEASAEQAALTG